MGLFQLAVGFLLGVYTGIFVEQNYNVGKVDPRGLYNAALEWLEKNKKKPDD